MSQNYTCYVGSHTDISNAKGISIFDVDVEKGALSLRKEVELFNAVAMAVSRDGRFLYSITDKGVAAFEIQPGGDLKRLNTGSIRGLRGCSLSVSPDNRWLFVSGHYDAKITVLSINPDGSVGTIADGVFHRGLGIMERDFVPHIRCAQLTPDGKYLCVSDDGLDQVVIYAFDQKRGTLNRLDMIPCKLQAGPGVMEFSADGRFLYVMKELICQISVYSYEDTEHGPKFEHIQSISSLGNHHSDVHIGVTLRLTPDNAHLLCTNAGNNSLGIFSRDAATGLLTQKNVLPVSGRYPTDVVMFPDEQHLCVTNFESDSMTFFTIDFDQGLIVMNQAPLKVPAPCCVVMAET